MNPLDAAAIRRRYLVLVALRWFPIGLLIPVLVLLLLSRGLTLVELGIVSAIQGLVILVLELPTGGLSDALGRRPVLILASVMSIVALALISVATSLIGFAVAAVLQGIFRALDSGPLEAWYVDETLAVAPDTKIESGLGAGGSVLSVGIALGAILSGALVALDPIPTLGPFLVPVLVSLGLTIINLGAIVLLLTEIRPAMGMPAVRASVQAVPGVVRDGLRLVRGSRVLAAVVLVELFWGFAMYAFEGLFPVRLSEVMGDPQAAGALLGPVTSAGWMASAIGAAVIVGVSRRTGVAWAAAVLRILQGLTVVAMGLVAGVAGLVIAYLACYLTHGASNPMHSTLLHREVDTRHRTTILSVNSMVSMPAGALGAVVLTNIAAGTSLSTAMIVAGVVCALAAPLYLPAWRAERRRVASSTAAPG